MLSFTASSKQFQELTDPVMSHYVTLTLLLGQHCKNEIEKKYKRLVYMLYAIQINYIPDNFFNSYFNGHKVPRYLTNVNGVADKMTDVA